MRSRASPGKSKSCDQEPKKTKINLTSTWNKTKKSIESGSTGVVC